MQAIILAAGMGKRLKELTKEHTKCMVMVNGVTLIERMLTQIDNLQLSRIVVVVGYEGLKLIEFIKSLDVHTPLVFVNNPIYDRTNNIYSLALAKEWLLTDDTILLESDLIFENSVLDAIVTDPRDTLALVDRYESWMDGTCVKLSDDDTIEAFIPGKKINFDEIKSYYKTVNIYKFSKHFSKSYYVPFLDAYQSALGENEYYEQVLRVITLLDVPAVRAKRLNGQKWYEIDDLQDLDIAESLFTPNDDEKVKLLQIRYGGYWRYPKLLDFCYFTNPYFPPKRLKDEMRANFDTLLTEYPSCMHVTSLLAAKNFGVHRDNIVVGNGAAELIKSLMSIFIGNLGLIRPIIEEYPKRYEKQNLIIYTPNNNNCSYTAEDVMSFFDGKNIQNLVIVNPDNPSGNYIPKNDLVRLIDWCNKKHCRIVVDESFADFADESNNSLIDMKLLTSNHNLYVIKSLSMSYGIPGLRVGVLASGDVDVIASMKKDVAIWNINSFAEFFMQIAEKYKNEYKIAIDKFRFERSRFEKELAMIEGIRVSPSQANFIMIELDSCFDASLLLKRLLLKHNILIKNLQNKLPGRNYLRIAVRTTEDNDALLKAIRVELHDFEKSSSIIENCI